MQAIVILKSKLLNIPSEFSKNWKPLVFDIACSTAPKPPSVEALPNLYSYDPEEKQEHIDSNGNYNLGDIKVEIKYIAEQQPNKTYSVKTQKNTSSELIENLIETLSILATENRNSFLFIQYSLKSSKGYNELDFLLCSKFLCYVSPFITKNVLVLCANKQEGLCFISTYQSGYNFIHSLKDFQWLRLTYSNSCENYSSWTSGVPYDSEKPLTPNKALDLNLYWINTGIGKNSTIDYDSLNICLLINLLFFIDPTFYKNPLKLIPKKPVNIFNIDIDLSDFDEKHSDKCLESDQFNIDEETKKQLLEPYSSLRILSSFGFRLGKTVSKKSFYFYMLYPDFAKIKHKLSSKHGTLFIHSFQMKLNAILSVVINGFLSQFTAHTINLSPIASIISNYVGSDFFQEKDILIGLVESVFPKFDYYKKNKKMVESVKCNPDGNVDLDPDIDIEEYLLLPG